MRIVTFFRVVTVVAMAATLVAGSFRPDLFPVLRRILFWLVPLWIGVLFLVQAVATPDASGKTPLEVWMDRIRGRTWTCRRCGTRYAWEVPLCGECAELRPDVAAEGKPWVCAVCESENEVEAVACSQCTVPRPDTPRTVSKCRGRCGSASIFWRSL